MRILHVINTLGAGGAEKLLEQTLPLLNRIGGVEADVLLLRDRKNVYQKNLQAAGVRVEVVPLRRPHSLLNVPLLRWYIGRGGYDIVHAHLFPARQWVALARASLKNGRKIKCITTKHNTADAGREGILYRMFDRFVFRQFDRVICVSEKARENLLKRLAPEEQELFKYKVVNNGVDTSRFRDAVPVERAALHPDFNAETRLIGMVARFSDQKDQQTLIRAMARLPQNAHLLLMGDGPLRAACESLARECGVGARVHFPGFRDDVPRVLKTCDIVVLSSHWEGLSLSSIEGMASGRPFVASRVEGLQEVVEGHGLLFAPGNADELAGLLCRLLEDAAFRDETARRCSLRAEDFKLETMLDGILETYREVIEEAGGK